MSDTMHIHTLDGCAPTPLAHYLKALGVLRLVAEQLDPSVRGWWEGDRFRLATRLNRDALQRFFLHEYQPTPLIAPWNGGSGFYPKDKMDGIEAIEGSTAGRFDVYRSAIEEGRAVTAGLDERPTKGDKAELIQRCRRRWRGPLLGWLDAVLTLDGEGEPRYPALLGSGGNDGRLDYTNNFMQRLAELFDCDQPDAPPRPGTADLLRAALHSQPRRDRERGAIGQFLPGDAGGANSGVGFEGGAGVNPWDFVLMLEGTLLFSSSVVRRARHGTLPQAAAPFAVAGSATGHGSAAQGEGNARGEQWMPLWEHPATAVEVASLLAEGRSQVRRSVTRRPLDMARAIGRLGVARGISGFERFGYVERYGRNNLAVPLGRWDVPTQPTPHADLLDDVARWVDSLRRAAGGKGAPGSLGRTARRCEEAMLACCRPSSVGASSGSGDPRRWWALLLALGEAEAQLVRSPGTTAGARLQPLPRLRPQWIAAAAGAGEAADRDLRLALAVAGLHGWAKHKGRTWRDPIRRHLLPLDEAELRKGQCRFAATERTLHKNPAVVVTGLDAQADLIAVLRRRVMEAGRGEAETKHLPLRPALGLTASPRDLAAVVRGEVDLGAVLALARPLMALDWRRWESKSYKSERWETLRQIAAPRPTGDDWGTLGLYGLFKLCHHHTKIEIGEQKFNVPLDPTILPRLLAGDLAGASERAKRRLRASGLPPVLGQAAGDVVLCRRLAAALVFPLSKKTADTLAGFLTRPEKDKKDERGDDAVMTPDSEPEPEGATS